MSDWTSPDNTVRILIGDVRERLRDLPDESVHCVVTSPPYWGLRDYGVAGQLGLESTPEEYVANMVEVFREVRRVLRSDGTCWVNLGDSYASQGGPIREGGGINDILGGKPEWQDYNRSRKAPSGLKPKDLCGIPWRVAFALQQPYYTGKIRDERDRVWLAAIIDGEGCFFIHKRKAGTSAYSSFTKADGSESNYERTADTYGVGLEICNTNKAIVNRVAEIVGGGTLTEQTPTQNNRRKQTIYRWRVAPNEAKRIAQEVYPYLVAKQHQARMLFNCPSNGDAGAAAHQAMMDLHNGIEASVDYPAPPSMFEPGWYLRQDVIWSKKNPMPESVTDRCTKAHEYVFLLAKSARYYYDAEAVKEASTDKADRVIPEGYKATWSNGNMVEGKQAGLRDPKHFEGCHSNGRNRRSVWTVATAPCPEAHFATYPPKLIEPMILAGTSNKGCCSTCGMPWARVVENKSIIDPRPMTTGASKKNALGELARTTPQGRTCGTVESTTTGWQPTCPCGGEPVPCTVCDPFLGSGTTAQVARLLGRNAIGIELSPAYAELAKSRSMQNLEGNPDHRPLFT